MNLERKILDLKNSRKTLLDNAEIHLNAKDMEKYNAVMAEIGVLNVEIEACEKLLAEFNKNPMPAEMNIPVNNADDDNIMLSDSEKTRSGKDYFNAFVKAIKNGATIKTDRSNPDYAPLYNALVGGGDGEDGGYLVPVDVDHAINQFRRQFLDLSVYFNNESVNTLSGWRVIDKTPTNGLSKIDEMATLPRDDQPKFAKITYKVDKYGMILPVSNELLADNAANLTNYISWWFSRKEAITKNILVLNLLKLLTATAVTAGKEVEALKTALNKTLDPEIAVNAKFITNQSGFNALDLLVDTTGKPLLQPDISDTTQYKLKGKKIVVVSDANLPNVSGKAPVFVGDYTQYGTLFTRNPFEMVSTNIGGNAWTTDSTEVRGIVRLDAEVFDNKSAVYLQLPI